jgi:hypothetical protein
MGMVLKENEVIVMGSALVLCLALVGGAPGEDSLTADERKAYQEAKAKAGRDAEAHVRLAIWCAWHGMEDEQQKHLAIALLIDPQNARARALLEGAKASKPAAKAGKPDTKPAAAKQAEAPPAPPAGDAAILAEYNARRANTPNTADAQCQLALWCEKKGLKAESLVHLSNVVQLDPSRDAAWKRLGFRQHNGRWMNDQQIAAEKIALETQKKADHHWKPLLAKWKSALGNPAKRDEAEKALAALVDPWAVNAIWQVFGTGDPQDQLRAVQLLGQMAFPHSSRLLAVLTIGGKTDDVRRAALEVLTKRDPMEFVDLWIGLLRKPLVYEVRPVAGPGASGEVYVEGERFNVRRLYAAPSILDTFNRYAGPMALHPVIPLGFGSMGGPSSGAAMNAASSYGTGLYWYNRTLSNAGAPDPILAYQLFEAQIIQQMILLDWVLSETQKMTLGAQVQQANDVKTLEAYNASVRQTNTRAGEALASVTGRSLGDDREAWVRWWHAERGYVYNPPNPPRKQTHLWTVPLPYMPAIGPPIVMPMFGGPVAPDWSWTAMAGSIW